MLTFLPNPRSKANMLNRAAGLILLLLLAILTYAQNSADDIAGVWRGNSNCMVKDSPCHDEVNVYRIAKVPGKPDWMTVTGSKIVNGSEVVMSTSDWKYDAAKHTLDSPDGNIHLDITGNKIEGALTLPDKTVYRRIHLKKE